MIFILTRNLTTLLLNFTKPLVNLKLPTSYPSAALIRLHRESNKAIQKRREEDENREWNRNVGIAS